MIRSIITLYVPLNSVHMRPSYKWYLIPILRIWLLIGQIRKFTVGLSSAKIGMDPSEIIPFSNVFNADSKYI